MSTPQFQNVASGNAQVGMQIGQNTGSVSMGRPAVPGAVEAELGRLLAGLRQAHQRGQVDTDTLAEAEHEIEVTRSALPERGRAIRALRRAGGMLEGVAGLAALVGAAVAAVEGLPS
jgi:hypothetical protein